MIKHLRWRLTCFNTLITGAVLLSMTFLCLFVSEQNIRENAFESFRTNMNHVCSYLREENQVSLSWLHRMESGEGTLISILDGGKPLFSTGFYEHQEEAEADFRQAFSLLEEEKETLSFEKQLLFSMEGTENYYVGFYRLPKENGELSVLLLFPLRPMEQRIVRQRIIVWTGSVAALVLLGIFSWCFTGKMLRPIEENQRRQAEFVAAASHELRTPLAGMLSAAGAMEKAEEGEKQRFYRMIQQEGQRMTRLIGDLLTLASGDSGSWKLSLRPSEIDMLLLNTFEIFQPRARERGLTLRISLPEEEIPVIQLDPDRLEQALAVLLDNALSYTPAPGTIDLSLSRLGNRVRITVSDTGPGIPDGEKEKIFLRFHRCEKGRTDPGHFGLGLSIAVEIIRQMGGRLWAEDAEGGGAAFCIELPIALWFSLED